MSTEVAISGGSYTSDGFTVTSTDETAEQIAANLEAEPAPKDGPAPDPEKEEAERVSKAASELGKKGGKAAAEKRAAEKEQAPKEEAKPEPAEKAAADEDEEKPEESEEQKRERLSKRDARSRVLEATRKESEAKRRAAEAEQRAALLEARLAEIERRVAPKPEETPARESAPTDDDPEPREDEFEDYGQYVRAAARWEYRQEAKKHEAIRQQQMVAVAAQRAIQQTVSTFTSRIAEARKNTPDFDARVEAVAALQPTIELPDPEQATGENFLADELLNSEMAPALMLHLSAHPDELQRIALLTSRRAMAREVAKLEARLEAATTRPTASSPVSKAHPPVRPVTGTPTTVDEPDPENEDFDAYMRRVSRERKRR